MKSFILSIVVTGAWAVLSPGNGTASAQSVYSDFGVLSGGTEEDTVLTINADGSSAAVTQTSESRKAAEQQVRLMERLKKMAEGGNENAADSSSTNAPRQLSDAELARKIIGMMIDQGDAGMSDSGQKLNVDVKENLVRITATSSFASIKDMLASDFIWDKAGVIFENVRFETDTNGLLRITLTPRRGMDRYLNTFRSEWKLSGMKTELKVVFPGNVISSGFPETQSNATWLAINATNDASLDAAAKLYAAPTVITAEAGGLKLDRALESSSLRISRGDRAAVGEDLPITEAGQGFAAEAQNLSITTLHVFPSGRKYFEDNGGYFGSQTGVTVSARLFAPRGRTLLSVSDVHVLSAVDDLGRSVAADDKDSENVQSESYSGGSSDGDSLDVELHLQLPQPDAQAINNLSAEAVAVTAGSWQDLTLTNIQENATNGLDLSSLLPGTKMIITKFSSKNNLLTVEARLQGPPAIRRLEVRAKVPGNDDFNTVSSDSRFNIDGGQATRVLTIRGYGFGAQGPSSGLSPVLIVRCPGDLRRERLKFNLKGLDLL